MTIDPAMLVFLNGIDNRRRAVNENYARELMELFTLGADRGAYTETDVRELARSLTGWRADWTAEAGLHNFRFDATRWDTDSKIVFGRTGAFDWEDAVSLVVEHPLHASFFVAKLWSYFVPAPPPADVAAALDVVHALGPKVIVVTSLHAADTPKDVIDLVVSAPQGRFRVRTPLLPLSVNGAGDAISALFFVHYLQTRDAGEALARAASSVYGLLKRTADAGSREILLVEAQDEFVKPTTRFEAEKI
jgi:hypothetical protein